MKKMITGLLVMCAMSILVFGCKKKEETAAPAVQELKSVQTSGQEKKEEAIASAVQELKSVQASGLEKKAEVAVTQGQKDIDSAITKIQKMLNSGEYKSALADIATTQKASALTGEQREELNKLLEKAKKGLLSKAEELKKQGTEAVKKAEGALSNTLKKFGK